MKTIFKIYIAGILYKIIKLWLYLFGQTHDIIRVNRHGIMWQLDLREGIDLAIYIFGKFEAETVEAYTQWIEPGDTVLDIGANIGAHTLWFARLVSQEGFVLAFEPTKYAYDKLIINTQLNPDLKSRITIAQVILGREDRDNNRAQIYSSWTVTGTVDRHPKHRGELKSTEGASMLTLDSYLSQQRIKRVDFIKIDVDGYECDVLKGAQATLKQYKPILCIELSPYALEERGASMIELVKILSDCHYQLFHEKTGQKLTMDAVQLCQYIRDGASINAIAKPVKKVNTIASD